MMSIVTQNDLQIVETFKCLQKTFKEWDSNISNVWSALKIQDKLNMFKIVVENLQHVYEFNNY